MLFHEKTRDKPITVERLDDMLIDEKNDEIKELKEENESLMQKIAELREKAIMDEKAIYARGKQIGAREIAKELLNKDMPIEEIIKITRLTKEEIEKIDDLTKEERMQRIAELREKAIMDEKAIYAKGLDIGGIEEKRKIAQNMLAENIAMDIISRMTGLTIEEIEKIKK